MKAKDGMNGMIYVSASGAVFKGGGMRELVLSFSGHPPCGKEGGKTSRVKGSADSRFLSTVAEAPKCNRH